MKDGSTLLTQLLDDLGRTKAALTEAQRECTTLREENDRFRKERSEVAEKIAASLDTVSDALLRFRDGSPAPAVGSTTQSVAAAAPSALRRVSVRDPVVSATRRTVTRPPSSPRALVAPPAPKEPRDPGAPHILVVDDDTSFRTMLSHYLSETRRLRGHVRGERRGGADAAHEPSAPGRRAGSHDARHGRARGPAADQGAVPGSLCGDRHRLRGPGQRTGRAGARRGRLPEEAVQARAPRRPPQHPPLARPARV